MSPSQAMRAVAPLKLVAWGGLFCVFDFTINGFDLFNDAVGAALIALGTARLRRLPVEKPYPRLMGFVLATAALTLAVDVGSCLQLEFPSSVGPVAEVLYKFAQVAAILAFSAAIVRLAEETELGPPARSLNLTRWFFLTVYVIPMGLIYSAIVAALLAGHPFKIHVGAQFLWGLAAFLVPLAHLYLSARRLRFHAERAAVQEWLPISERTCLRCGYPLRGLPEPRCPECGTAAVVRPVSERLPVTNKRASVAPVVIAALVVSLITAAVQNSLWTRRGQEVSLGTLNATPAQIDRVEAKLDTWLRVHGFAPTGTRPSSYVGKTQTVYRGSHDGSAPFTIAMGRVYKDQLELSCGWLFEGYSWHVDREEQRVRGFIRELLTTTCDELAIDNPQAAEEFRARMASNLLEP